MCIYIYILCIYIHIGIVWLRAPNESRPFHSSWTRTFLGGACETCTTSVKRAQLLATVDNFCDFDDMTSSQKLKRTLNQTRPIYIYIFVCLSIFIQWYTVWCIPPGHESLICRPAPSSSDLAPHATCVVPCASPWPWPQPSPSSAQGRPRPWRPWRRRQAQCAATWRVDPVVQVGMSEGMGFSWDFRFFQHGHVRSSSLALGWGSNGFQWIPVAFWVKHVRVWHCLTMKNWFQTGSQTGLSPRCRCHRGWFGSLCCREPRGNPKPPSKGASDGGQRQCNGVALNSQLARTLEFYS